MAAILGMVGTGQFTDDERPRNWRQGINLVFPNGDAPLTAILSMMPDERTDDPDFRWFEKGLPTQRAITQGAKTTDPPAPGDDVAAGQADGATAYLLVTDPTIFLPGQVLMNLATEENLLVISVSTTNSSVAVRRDHGNKFATNPAITGDPVTGDAILVVGNGSPEGADSRDAQVFQPYRHYNLTQIFRNSLEFTRTALRTRLRYDREGPYLEAQREAYQLHSLDLERALLLGERSEVTAIAGGTGNLIGVSAGKPLRTTRGMLNWLPAISQSPTVPSVHWDIGTAFSGVINEKTADQWCEELFRYGNDEKLVLCGGTFLNAWNRMAKNKFTIEAVPTDQTYGLALTRYLTPFGSLLFRQHPLLSTDPVLRKDAFALDVEFLKLRVLDDTEFKQNVQGNGIDGHKDEFLTELGLEVHFSGAAPSTAGGLPGTPGPAAHGRMKGVTDYAP
jgi:hypothetical protein